MIVKGTLNVEDLLNKWKVCIHFTSYVPILVVVAILIDRTKYRILFVCLFDGV
jgi:hypothetical protein